MYIFEQIFQYLDEYYFSASLGSYDNFEIESTFTLLVIIGGLCFGMFIASVAAVIQKKHVGKMARALLAQEANSPESAKTLDELGLSRSVFVKMSLSSASVLRKTVSVVDGDEVFTYFDELAAAYPEYQKNSENSDTSDKNEKSDTPKKGEEKGSATAENEALSILDSEKELLKKRRFKLRKLDYTRVRFFIEPSLCDRAAFRFKESGSSWWTVLISFFAVLVLFFLSLRLLPVLVKMLDATISNFKGL